MSHDRGVCTHYQFEGEGGCDLGKKCEFWGHCQTCPSHSPKKGCKKREDLRRKKKERIARKEFGQIC